MNCHVQGLGEDSAPLQQLEGLALEHQVGVCHRPNHTAHQGLSFPYPLLCTL